MTQRFSGAARAETGRKRKSLTFFRWKKRTMTDRKL
jgi:hypothetical protein